jgi:hypothetical protein
VTIWLRRVSLAKRSRSSFTFLYLLCVDELVPLSNDADEGYQWKIQTDEGWIPYWDPSQAWVAEEGILFYGEENVLNERDELLPLNSELSFEASFDFNIL